MSDPQVEEIGPEDDEGIEAFRPAKPKTETARQFLAIRTGGTLAPIVPNGSEQLIAMAKMLHASKLVPKDLTSDQVAACIMFGAEIGLMPMQSLQGIAVINGRPSVWGGIAMALVRRSGLMAKHKEWIEDKGEIEIDAPDQNGELRKIKVAERIAHCLVQREDDEELDFTFSLSDARQAGLYPNPKKPIWMQYTDRMLKMRARGFAFRDVFSDVLAGLYLREEAQDFEPIDITPMTRVEPSGLSERLKQGATPGTGFTEAHVESEMATVSLWPPEEQLIISELAGLLAGATTPLEVKAIQMQTPADDISPKLRDKLVEMVEERLAQLKVTL
jgi:hypothetical protein